MRWTPNKLRSLLKESNYKLTKGYEIKKRSRLNGNMALSFLSGDEGTPSIKAIEARAYAREAAANILKARALKNELDASMNAEFIGMDDLGLRKSKPKKNTSQTSTRRQKRRTKRNAPRRSKPVCECPELLGLDEIGVQKKGEQTSTRIPREQRQRSEPPPPVQIDPNAPLGPNQARATGPSKPSMMVTTLPPVQSRAAAPKTTQKAAVAPILPSRSADSANVTREVAAQQVQEAREKALEAAKKAEEAAQEMDQPSGFFQGKNMLLIGGVAVAALAGIYFLTKKK